MVLGCRIQGRKTGAPAGTQDRIWLSESTLSADTSRVVGSCQASAQTLDTATPKGCSSVLDHLNEHQNGVHALKGQLRKQLGDEVLEL